MRQQRGGIITHRKPPPPAEDGTIDQFNQEMSARNTFIREWELTDPAGEARRLLAMRRRLGHAR